MKADRDGTKGSWDKTSANYVISSVYRDWKIPIQLDGYIHWTMKPRRQSTVST
jgi:hypothetical protein